MPSFPPGLYEILVTKLIEGQLGHLDGATEPEVAELRTAEAADRIALHLSSIVERAIESAPEADRAEVGVRLARRLTDLVVELTDRADLGALQLADPARMLRAIRRRLPDGTPEAIAAPLIPLVDTTILTNARGEPTVGHQIMAEIDSADRIDLIMAFIRRSGLGPLRQALRRHLERGKPVRILTTVFTGTTEPAALEELRSMGAEVRVSYDRTGTRLHAKAWLFHRASGFATAYVGSSNLTHAAQVTGLEWNVRISAARNRPVIEKIGAVFESYWQQPEFEPYDAERFKQAVAPLPEVTGKTLSPLEVRLEPFQERLLEQLAISREQGYHRNLLVSATGTGKTVMAAVDYATLRNNLSSSRLLFVAHREEILTQSLRTFRHVLRDGSFGELWVGGQRPQAFSHVFASVQSLAANGLPSLENGYFDVVIIDEFHHAAAASYETLLNRLEPQELLGLTATPERADGLPVLHWFGNRIAAELRLWDAIDQHRLVPFSYYGIADELDLTAIPWRRGTGYDVAQLTGVITGTDVWARTVLSEFKQRLDGAEPIRALGFCVSVGHARYMARVFTEHGISSVAVTADTPELERLQALKDLNAGIIKAVFSVDLFNEGVDVPSVNALLMLRPTESPLLFLQQLGRGLRKSQGKALCTVLDFVGQHRKEFRYDARFQALLGGSRADVTRQVEQGFPFLPSGCSMQLDPVAQARVLASIRNAIPSTWPAKVAELRQLAAARPDLTLGDFLADSGLDLADLYGSNRSWSDLRAEAGLPVQPSGPSEDKIRRAIGRLLHVDDVERLKHWREWVANSRAPQVSRLSERERRVLRMLLAQLLESVGRAHTLEEGVAVVWAHPQVLVELSELLTLLMSKITHLTLPLSVLPDVPFMVHATYTRKEILGALQSGDRLEGATWREGVRFDQDLKTDVFLFTLDKTKGQFSPTTRYRDYAISRELVHWESQSTTSAASPTGQRYQNHASIGSHVLLFARLSSEDRGFAFLGPATYVRHVGELPMAITWRLSHALPGDLFEKFAAAVA